MVQKQLTPFDIVRNILRKETKLCDEVVDKLPSYMITKIISNDEQLVFYANIINRSNISNKMVYNFYYFGIPKTFKNISYNSKKLVIDKEIRYLMEYYRCNKNTASDYYKLLPKEDIKEIIEYYENRGVKQ